MRWPGHPQHRCALSGRQVADVSWVEHELHALSSACPLTPSSHFGFLSWAHFILWCYLTQAAIACTQSLKMPDLYQSWLRVSSATSLFFSFQSYVNRCVLFKVVCVFIMDSEYGMLHATSSVLVMVFCHNETANGKLTRGKDSSACTHYLQKQVEQSMMVREPTVKMRTKPFFYDVNIKENKARCRRGIKTDEFI